MANFLDQNTAERITREYALSNPRQQPESAADSMTQATLTGADVAGQRYSQQKQGQAIMDTVSRRLAQGLLGSKAAYAQGQAIYDNAENDEQALAGQLLMNKAAEQAQSIRQSAGAAGLDLSRFGEGITYQQAMQNMQDDTTRGLANIFGGKDISSDDYYNQQYAALRAKHYTEKQARDEAARRAGAYQAQRISRLTDAFQNYGTTGDSIINADGARILNMIAQEDAGRANGLAELFASPKAAYATQVAQQAADAKYQQQLALNDRKAQQQMNLAGYRAALRAANGSGGAGSSGLSQRAMLEQYFAEGLDLFDGDEEQAQRYAYEKVNQIKASGKPSKQDKYDGYDKKTFDEINELNVNLDEIEKLIQQAAQFPKESEERRAAIEETGNRLEPLQRQINTLQSKMSSEDFEGLQGFKDNIEFLRNKLLLELSNPNKLDDFPLGKG